MQNLVLKKFTVTGVNEVNLATGKTDIIEHIQPIEKDIIFKESYITKSRSLTHQEPL